ncbi:MAG TPA: hypothetical protein VNR87_17340 [Flavisolibacter sp.]|nr:hypothetical protein [Flavisolibacter sp.]
MKTVKTALLYIICLMPLTVFVSFISCNKSYALDAHGAIKNEGKLPAASTMPKQKAGNMPLATNN